MQSTSNNRQGNTHPLWMRLIPLTTAILSVCSVVATASSAFLLKSEARTIGIIVGLAIAIFTLNIFLECRFLLNRYFLTADRMIVEDFFTRKQTVLSVSSVKSFSRFVVSTLKPKQGETLASSGWRIETTTGDTILVTEALPIYPAIVSRFHPLFRNES